MKHIRLMAMLKGLGLKLHKSRLEFLSLLMVALVQAKTVNLAELVGMMESRAQEASLYRRAQRFLGEFVHTRLKPIRTKLHGRKQKSLFRTGLDHLRYSLANANIRKHHLDRCCEVLSCT